MMAILIMLVMPAGYAGCPGFGGKICFLSWRGILNMLADHTV